MQMRDTHVHAGTQREYVASLSMGISMLHNKDLIIAFVHFLIMSCRTVEKMAQLIFIHFFFTRQ